MEIDKGTLAPQSIGYKKVEFICHTHFVCQITQVCAKYPRCVPNIKSMCPITPMCAKKFKFSKNRIFCHFDLSKLRFNRTFKKKYHLNVYFHGHSLPIASYRLDLFGAKKCIFPILSPYWSK